MITRNFYPGEDWLYLKIYTGYKTSDIILIEALNPFLNDLHKSNIILKWFFIRYNDPKHHLRIRLHLSSKENYFLVLFNINQKLNSYINSREISEIALDTYKRELERYGENTIEFAERLFFKSSEISLNFLNYDDEEKIILTIFYIENFFSILKTSLEDKMEWIENFSNAFKKEFHVDKKLNLQLKNKYEQFYPKYKEFVDALKNEEIRNLINNNITETKFIIEEMLYSKKDDLLTSQKELFFQSIFHMHINRIFNSEQRLFEMIVYDYFLRFYNK